MALGRDCQSLGLETRGIASANTVKTDFSPLERERKQMQEP